MPPRHRASPIVNIDINIQVTSIGLDQKEKKILWHSCMLREALPGPAHRGRPSLALHAERGPP